MSRFLKTTLRQLYQLFSDRKASPQDETKYGETLLHYACKRIHKMGLDSPDMFSAYRQFINGIIDFGVSPDQVTLSLETPVDIFLRNAWWPHRFNEESCSRVADISIDLIDNGATFSEEAIDGTCARIDVGAMCGVSTLQSSLLIIKEIGNRDGGMEGFSISEIAKGVCTQSESLLRRALANNQTYVDFQDRKGRTPLHFAANWPYGVAILLGRGADIRKTDRFGWSPLHYAYSLKCLASVQLMLQADSVLYNGQSCTIAVLEDGIASRDTQILEVTIAALVERRLRLERLAEAKASTVALELRHDKMFDNQAFETQTPLESSAIPADEASPVAAILESVYQAKNLDCWAADKLFCAGFRHVDRVDETGLTPLMKLRIQLFTSRPFADALKLGIWLTSHGAIICRTLPTSSASVRHQLGADFGYYLMEAIWFGGPVSHQTIRARFHSTIFDLDDHCRAFLLDILTRDKADNWVCACSYHGCRALIKMLRVCYSFVDGIGEKTFGTFPAEMGKIWLIGALVDFVMPYLRGDDSLLREIVRFVTFDRLDLTHTCCNTDSPIEDCLKVAEVQEIREEERLISNDLEELLASFEPNREEFEALLESLLGKHWLSRMGHSPYEKKISAHDSVLQARKLGVILEWDPA